MASVSMTTVDEVGERIKANIPQLEANITKIAASLPLTRSWVDSESLAAGIKRETALLEAARLSLLECATGWALGLNRAGAGSLRTFVENSICWLYYKDHPVEFDLVLSAKFEMMLPKAVQKYLKDTDTGFEKAYKLLQPSMKRPNEYYYTDISAFVHGHPNFVISGLTASQITVSTPPNDSFGLMCDYADEFVSDQFMTAYRHSWGAIPELVQAYAKVRLGKKLAEFLAVA
jgi:hypothetical protein